MHAFFKSVEVYPENGEETSVAQVSCTRDRLKAGVDAGSVDVSPAIPAMLWKEPRGVVSAGTKVVISAVVSVTGTKSESRIRSAGPSATPPRDASSGSSSVPDSYE